MIYTLTDTLAREGMRIENGCVPASLAAKAILKKEGMITEALYQLQRALKITKGESKMQMEIQSEILATIESLQEQMKGESIEAAGINEANVVSIFTAKKIA